MADVRQLLSETLAQLDSAKEIIRHKVTAALESVCKEAKAAGEAIPELRFELIAAYLALYDEPNVWGTYFGPELSSITPDGRRSDLPPIESITAECIAYWTARMTDVKHPALRARYGDLVWDLSQRATGNRPPIAAAHIAIDGYVDAIVTGRCKPFDGSGNVQKRAIFLAASVDANRLRSIVPRLQQYAASPPEPAERDRYQLELFGMLTELRGNRQPNAKLQSLATDLRTRLNELDREEVDKFTIQNIALPLASYCWSSQQPDEAKSVIRIWGAAVERMANETSMAMLASAWLGELHEVYQRYEMHDEARKLVSEIEAKSAGIEKELVHISNSTLIPEEEFNRVIDDLCSGTKAEVIGRLARSFLPSVGDTEKLVNEIASKTIYMHLRQQIVAEDGRVTASIGPVSEDLTGHVVQQLNLVVQFYGQLFRPAVEASISRLSLTEDDFIAWLAECPLFTEDRLKLLRVAIGAYLRSDWFVAIHLAIPQIEYALRRVLVLCKQPLTRPSSDGVFFLKNLNQVLHDPATEQVLPRDVRVYLQTLLCDQRGLNIRNNVCHGLWNSEDFDWFVADRVIHALLVIGLLRSSTAAHSNASPVKENE